MNATKDIIIAGANSSIAVSLTQKYRDLGFNVWTLSRGFLNHKNHFQCDLLDKGSRIKLIDLLKQLDLKFQLVIHCAGILHDDKYMPEKQLSSIESDWLHKSLDVNVMTHVYLAQCLENHIETKGEFKWVSLSAMVGSISDNYLGGWYSYRMTKAALNMFIRGLAIEWKRKNPRASLVAMHPGTTDTPMSRPFKVRPDKLYSPDLSASRMIELIASIDASRSGTLINWDGNQINF